MELYPGIIFGRPNERPSPLNIKGKVFIDYVTPAAYLSLGNEWQPFSGNGTLTYLQVITALGYIPEDVANKATDLTSPNDTTYPTTLAVANAIAAISTSSSDIYAFAAAN